MPTDFSRTNASLTKLKTVHEGLVAYTTMVTAKIREYAGDQAKEIALADALDAQVMLSADALVAGTAAVNEPPATEPPIVLPPPVI